MIVARAAGDAPVDRLVPVGVRGARGGRAAGARRVRARAAKVDRIVLPAQRLRLRAGRQGTVSLRLTGAAWKRLGSHRSATARVSVGVRQDGRTVSDAIRFRLRLRR